MNCKNCGSPLTAEDQFCKNCGAPVNEMPAQPTNNMNNMNNQVEENPPVNNDEIPDTNSENVSSSVPNNIEAPNISAQTPNTYQNPTPNPNPNQYQSPIQNPIPNPIANPAPAPNAPYPTKTQTNNNSKNNNMMLIIIGIIAVVVIVILAIVLIPKFTSNSNGGNNGGKVNNNGGASVTPVSNSTYKINFAGFTLRIPDNMTYKISTKTLMVGDEAGTWMVELTIADGSYTKLKTNKSQLHSYFQQNGITSKPAEVKTLGSSEFITIEMEKGGLNFVGAYAKLNSMKTAWMIVYNQDNTFDYDIVKQISSIISTAEYNESSHSIEEDPIIDFNTDEVFQFARE